MAGARAVQITNSEIAICDFAIASHRSKIDLVDCKPNHTITNCDPEVGTQLRQTDGVRDRVERISVAIYQRNSLMQ